MSEKPVFGIDIDGTLADYHPFFRWFATMYTGVELNIKPYQGDVSFAKHLGLGKSRYREVKLAFRQSGLKRAMPVQDGARDLTRGLRRAGAEVVLCTTRPYLHLSNIEPDTREWAKRNGIQYDDVIHGEHKYRTLKKRYGTRVVAVLDDLPEMVVQAADLEMISVLREQPHNTPTNWLSVPDLYEAHVLLYGLLQEWKADQ